MSASGAALSGEIRFPAAGLTAALSQILEAAGAGPGEAAEVAGNLVGANLRGHDSHGIVRLPRYLLAVERDHVRFGQTVSLLLDSPAFALLDGHHGFGQVLGRQAVELGIAKAKAAGVAVIGLRRAGHLGRIGHFAEQACAAGMVSVHFVNVAQSMLVAPFGGAGRRMSTAPVTIGVPEPAGGDFILDFATSRYAEGKVLVAMKSGQDAPEGSLIGADGQPTSDPSALYGPLRPGDVPNPRDGPGALLAMGDHKGSGLALACELLAGALTGSGTTGPGARTHNGMLSIYIDPAVMDQGEGFAAQVRDYVNFVRACPPSDPAQPVMIPGDPERRRLAERQAAGLPLPADIWEDILTAGERVGLDRGALRALAEQNS